MWIKTYSEVFQGFKKADVWRILIDVNNWPKWHSDLDCCAMSGTFTVGNHFFLKPKNMKSVKITLTEIKEEYSFTDCTAFFGAKMYDTHTMEETPEGLKLTNTLFVTGPLKYLWIMLVAKHVANTAPEEMYALINFTNRSLLLKMNTNENLSYNDESIQTFVSEENYRHREKDIANWWNNFSLANKKISASFSSFGDKNFDLARWMNKNLRSIDKNLIMWDFYSGIVKKHRLVIASEEQRKLKPLIRRILSSAPELEEWEFYTYRLPENLEAASNVMLERTGWKDIKNIKFTISRGRLNRIDITYWLPFFEEQKQGLENLYLLTNTLLGEEIAEKWIDDIHINKTEDTNGKKISELNPEVHAEITNIKNSLPEKPYFFTINDDYEWITAKRSPKQDGEEDFFDKDDVYFRSIISKQLLIAMDDKYFFDSERFSKNNEIFVYLKIERTDKDQDVKEFSKIKKALDLQLKQEQLGCIVGSAIGLKYLYIDLAIINTYISIQEIRKILKLCNTSRKIWLLFYDGELAYEQLKLQ